MFKTEKSPVFFMMLTIAFLFVIGCNGGDGNDQCGSSIEGESCASTADCVCGLRCVSQVCVRSGDEDATGELEREAVELEGETVEQDTEIAEHGNTQVTWVTIPAGSFAMGCSPGDADCETEESPSHNVIVPSFQLLETEVTQAQYESVIGSNPSSFSSCGGDCPVEQVDWNAAKAFCEALGGRLPSESEWEYAARAGTTTRYYCGDDESCLDGIGWYVDNSDSNPHPVATKTANAFGLYDMLGNVWEWVGDCWNADYNGAPSNGDIWSSGNCSGRVGRGGGWYSSARSARVSNRGGGPPGYRGSDGGFRCARD
jgi:formylglycine-generating enzyme required for sulfatase activity